MDPLSQVVSLLKPQPLYWRVIEAHDAWSIRFPTTDVVVFGQLIEGGCQVELACGSALSFRPGDFLLMAAPSSWTMGTLASGPSMDLKSVAADPGLLLSKAAVPTVTRVVAGAFAFAAPNADLLTGIMSPVIHVRGTEIAAGRLGALLELVADEALTSRPGRSLILDRLLEIILVESLRHRPTHLDDERPGLLAALEDEQIGAALRAMHKDVRRSWTVAELARQVGMSRSSFAARFTDTVGLPPVEYLMKWRISLAKSALTESKQPISEVAELAGYQSVSAFSTAFSRTTGVSPTTYVQSFTSKLNRQARQ